MAVVLSVSDLDEIRGKLLVQELKELDENVDKKIEYVMKQAGINFIDALEYVVTSDPMLWAAVYLGWQARDYQKDILACGKKKKKVVLRLGRRLGKTDSLVILILWFSCTQINKGPNNQYDILIIAPFETQINLIFKRLQQIIDTSPYLQSKIARSVEHLYEWYNGTTILGLTAGAKSGSGAANTRGQRADVIILDEVDYMGSNNISNILQIANEAPERIKVFTASTPCGKHEEFYKWCTGATISYRPKQEDIDNFRFSEYIIEENDVDGNGWTEIYAPSVVNKELLKINPDTGVTYLQDLQIEYSEIKFDQEVMARFGEEETGVYQRKYIDLAIEEGKRIGHKYLDYDNSIIANDYLFKNRQNIRILGVDWDKVQSCTNFACLEFDKLYVNQQGQIEPKFKVLFRVEIARGEFTYTNAVNKIIELNDAFDFDWIAVDRGYGDVQVEMLKKYGMQNPHTDLATKVLPYQFAEKIDARDPYTGKIDKKPLKPFMVNNSIRVFERGKIIFDPSDKLIVEQFSQYRYKKTSSTGVPQFTDENEHIIDAVNLCLLAFEQKYGDLLKRVISSKFVVIDGLDRQQIVSARDTLPESDTKNGQAINVKSFGIKNKYAKVIDLTRPKRNKSEYKRKSF